MASIFFEGFVCDEDSERMIPFLKRAKLPVYPLSRIGITRGKGSPDRAIQRHARDRGMIIVTGNVRHFRREMREAAKLCNSYACFEGGGLITVPNELQSAPFGRIGKTMKLGAEPIIWEDVFACNLRVAIYMDGSVRVSPLPICEIFKKLHSDCEPCMRLGIVPRLSV